MRENWGFFFGGGWGRGEWQKTIEAEVLIHVEQIKYIKCTVIQHKIYQIITVTLLLLSCWWWWVDWVQSGHAKRWTDKTCDKPWSARSSAQSLEWQPLPATKRNTAVSISCIVETWEFLIIVVGGGMIPRTLCRTSKPTNHTENENNAWWVTTRSTSPRSPVSVSLESRGAVHATRLPIFLPWKRACSFVVGYGDIVIRQETCKDRGERKWIFNPSALGKSFRK